jgi:hypothetical protein
MAKMVLVHFLENNSIVLSQLLKNIPSVDENIRIKGKKGKVLNVKKVDDTVIHVHVVFEKVTKNQPIVKDVKKKR